jgi:hypothetical protein
MDYMRIGTTYYKTIRKPMASGDSTTSMVTWSIECIKQDHGKSFLSSIPKYDGFCFVPSHLNYERVIENFYNRYSPFVHEPKAGYPTQTLVFLNHVFAEQLDLGLDFIKILLMHPTQMLPILCLVSTERNTGKTTFLNFLKAIFGDNMTLNSRYDGGSIKRVLQDEWKLQPSDNSNSYQQYRILGDGTIYEYTQKGRFYKLSEKEVLKLNNIDDFDDKSITN